MAAPRRLAVTVCALLLLSASVGAQVGPPDPLLVSTNPANGHQYTIFDVSDYHEARAIASVMNGYLASLPDASERQWAATAFPFAVPYIGLTSEAMPGTFVWESGEPLGTPDWAADEPIASTSPRYVRGIQSWETGSANSAGNALFEFELGVVPVVPAVQTELDGTSVEVSWDATAGTTATVLRNGIIIATVPAPVTSIVDAPPSGFTRYAVVLDTPAGIQLPGRSGIHVPDPSMRLSLADQTIFRPGLATSALILDQGVGPGQGMNAGICIDLTEVAVSDLALGSVFSSTLPLPGFVNLEAFSNGIYVALVYDLFGLTTLPVGTDYEMVTFQLESLTTGTVTTELRPCDEVGSPPISTGVIIDGGHWAPLLISGFITFRDLEFLRGDCNSDGSVDIADPLFLGLRLFDPAVSEFPCREACEANGDGAIDIADMVTVIGYLFAGGATPVAPFPDCGLDPAPDSAFECDPGTACP